MGKTELRRRRGIVTKIIDDSTVASFLRAFKSIQKRVIGKPDTEPYSGEFAEPYVHYDKQIKVWLQLLEMEKERGEATRLARRSSLC